MKWQSEIIGNANFIKRGEWQDCLREKLTINFKTKWNEITCRTQMNSNSLLFAAAAIYYFLRMDVVHETILFQVVLLKTFNWNLKCANKRERILKFLDCNFSSFIFNEWIHSWITVIVHTMFCNVVKRLFCCGRESVEFVFLGEV